MSQSPFTEYRHEEHFAAGLPRDSGRGRRRDPALHHRRHQVVRPGARGQRRDPRRRRRHPRAGERPHRSVPRPQGRAGHLPDRPRPQPVRVAQSKKIRDKGGNAPKCVQDIRKALDDKNLDAISIATPNHWHALMTIWACQAGKDVYVEKPMQPQRPRRPPLRRGGPASTTGSSSTAPRAAAAAAGPAKSPPSSRASSASCSSRKGSATSRAGASATKDHRAAAGGPRLQPLARPGGRAAVPRQPGPLQLALVLGLRQRRHRQPGRPPDGHRPLGDPGRDAADQGLSLGGRFGYSDQGQTPNTQIAVIDYGDAQLIFEVRGLVDKPGRTSPFKFKVLNEYYTTEGRIDGRASSTPRAAGSPSAGQVRRQGDARRARGAASSTPSAAASRRTCNADVPSTATTPAPCCHLANISYRLGEKVPFNGKAKTLGDNREVVETFKNLQENLKGVGVKLDETTYQLGRTLTVDPTNERFVGEGCGGREPPAQPAVSCAVRRAGNRVVGVELMSGALNIRHARTSSLAWPFISCRSRLQAAGMRWRPSHRSRRCTAPSTSIAASRRGIAPGKGGWAESFCPTRKPRR